VQVKSGQVAVTRGARIAGIVSALPPTVVGNTHFEDRFGAGVDEVAALTGVSTRHVAGSGVAASDMCYAAGRELLLGLDWHPDSVDGIVFISQSPDYQLPATACLLQDRLGLRTQSIAFDVNLGCSAYPYGLWLVMSLIQSGSLRRVLLAVGDVITRTLNPDERSVAMLFGDCGTVTAVEAADPAKELAHFVLGTNGRGGEKLIVPASPFRDRSTDDRFAGRSLEHLYMDGAGVFNFMLKTVPALIGDTMDIAEVETEKYSSFVFHQANKFMLDHLSKKARLPADKVPINIDRYGNTSGASIPLVLTSDVADALKRGVNRLGLFGFGVGFSWASASLDVGPLAVCETVIM
jgi:3-oxoacyl-[acyl-carrier-protein] synthase-3